MNKKCYRNDLIEEKYYEYIFESGFKIIVYPKKSVKKYAYLSCDYGSNDTKFIDIHGNMKQHPDGCAHFLEHKLFENSSLGIIDRMAKLGASVNAFTSYEITSYYFSCTDNFEEALKILLDIPIKTSYSEEGIKSEMDIISREIDMYRDDEDYAVYSNMMSELYSDHPVGVDIAGTKKSIQNINKKVLDEIVENFYVPDNMSLFIIGDFDENTIDFLNNIIPDYYKKKADRGTRAFNSKFKKRNFVRREIKGKTSIDNFSYGIRLNENEIDMNSLETQIHYNLILEILFGTSSIFYNENYNNGIISDLGFEFIHGKDFASVNIDGDSNHSQRLLSKIQEHIDCYNKNGVNREDIERIKRKYMGRYLMSFRNIKSTSNIFIKYRNVENIFEYIDILKRLDVNKGMRKIEGNKVFVVAKGERL